MLMQCIVEQLVIKEHCVVRHSARLNDEQHTFLQAHEIKFGRCLHCIAGLQNANMDLMNVCFHMILEDAVKGAITDHTIIPLCS